MAPLEQRGYEHELLYSEVIEHLRAIAAGVGVSQHALAERLGVSDARVSRIMTGRENLTLRTLADLGWALGLRFEVVAVPLADREGTPAAHDAAAPPWLRRHAQVVARRVSDAMRRTPAPAVRRGQSR
jgi:transcriptional regulator with XRE-family HTH domain